MNCSWGAPQAPHQPMLQTLRVPNCCLGHKATTTGGSCPLGMRQREARIEEGAVLGPAPSQDCDKAKPALGTSDPSLSPRAQNRALGLQPPISSSAHISWLLSSLFVMCTKLNLSFFNVPTLLRCRLQAAGSLCSALRAKHEHHLGEVKLKLCPYSTPRA